MTMTVATLTGGQRLLAAAASDFAAHSNSNGDLPWQGGIGRLIPTVEAAGLIGHGGAGFPTWRKLAAVATGERPVVIGNAAEGEPRSGKDHFLLTQAPHLVLDGLQLAAEAVGANKVFLYVPAGPAMTAARQALTERTQDRYRVKVVAAPDTFVAGEESALIARISGRKALPWDAKAVVSGVDGQPTLVQNVETLAHLAQIARHGAGWFRQLGTPAEPGTFLATLSGPLDSPGIYEVAYGTQLIDVIEAARPSAPLQAVLVGGFHGGWLSMLSARHTPLTNASLRPYGAATGAGVLVALPMAVCALSEVSQIIRYLADESAGQCGPCLNGLPALADTLEALAAGHRGSDLVRRLQQLTALVAGRGACHHPDGAARFVHSSLRAFNAEVELHLVGRCSTRRLPTQTQP